VTRLRTALSDASPPALVFALAVPFLFLHRNYQPHFALGQVDVDLTDLAIVACVLAGLVAGIQGGFEPLKRTRFVWIALAAFLAFTIASIAWAHAGDSSYPVESNVISALKFVEYAFLAPAAALALRRAGDRRLLFLSVAGWSVAMTIVAVLQFLGYLDQLNGHQPNGRESSYLGEHDFAALSGAALSLLFAGVLLRRERVLGIVSGCSGALGIALAAALDAVGALWVTLVAALLVVRRHGVVSRGRMLALIALCAVITLGAVSLRSSSIAAFLRFVGLESENTKTVTNVQSYAHRTLLAYIGVEIWLHHPIVGVGWQESARPHSFDPYLAGARKHFGKSEPAAAFPSPQHMWGVQNGIVQTLADLGIVGLALLLIPAVAVVRLLLRSAGRAPPGTVFESIVVLGWLLFGFASFVGTGLVAGLVVESQLWIGVGLAVALATGFAEERESRAGTLPA
jgi:hypothetical protein